MSYNWETRFVCLFDKDFLNILKDFGERHVKPIARLDDCFDIINSFTDTLAYECPSILASLKRVVRRRKVNAVVLPLIGSVQSQQELIKWTIRLPSL